MDPKSLWQGNLVRQHGVDIMLTMDDSRALQAIESQLDWALNAAHRRDRHLRKIETHAMAFFRYSPEEIVSRAWLVFKYLIDHGKQFSDTNNPIDFARKWLQTFIKHKYRKELIYAKNQWKSFKKAHHPFPIPLGSVTRKNLATPSTINEPLPFPCRKKILNRILDQLTEDEKALFSCSGSTQSERLTAFQLKAWARGQYQSLLAQEDIVAQTMQESLSGEPFEYTPEDAAEFLGVSAESVRRLLQREKLHSWRTVGGVPMIEARHLQQFARIPWIKPFTPKPAPIPATPPKSQESFPQKSAADFFYPKPIPHFEWVNQEKTSSRQEPVDPNPSESASNPMMMKKRKNPKIRKRVRRVFRADCFPGFH